LIEYTKRLALSRAGTQIAKINLLICFAQYGKSANSMAKQKTTSKKESTPSFSAKRRTAADPIHVK
jgi:hypothetical protein